MVSVVFTYKSVRRSGEDRSHTAVKKNILKRKCAFRSGPELGLGLGLELGDATVHSPFVGSARHVAHCDFCWEPLRKGRVKATKKMV
jgi:hypothetical protein